MCKEKEREERVYTNTILYYQEWSGVLGTNVSYEYWSRNIGISRRLRISL